MSIVADILARRQLCGLAVLRQDHPYAYTPRELKKCCAKYPNGCDHENECHRLYDAKPPTWGYKIPTRADRTGRSDPGSWMPTLSTRHTVYAIRRIEQEENL